MSRSKLTIVFGGQFGSEGKGQVAAFVHAHQPCDIAVRVGGPNAGHTFHYPNGKKEVVQSVPVAAMLGALGVIGAAGLVLPELLAQELQRGYDYLKQPVDLLIDANAAIISEQHMAAERELKKEIGSTGEGVGAATAQKVMRKAATAASGGLLDALHTLIGRAADGVQVATHTASTLNEALLDGQHVLLEGTQGFGLSLHTGGYYPFCTSRECTPQGLLADTGISPDNAYQVETIMVVRTFPIRVGGNSGPLANEISWPELEQLTNGYVRTPEITTVTKKQRRIARLDWDLLQRAVLQCRPSALAVTFFDYLHPDAAGITDASALSRAHWASLNEFEERLDVPVKIVSTGLDRTLSLRVTA